MPEPESNPRVRGHCLCGAVAFEVHGPVRAAVACHCDECRRFTGSFWTATAALRADLRIKGSEHVRWFALNERSRRGFCGNCGTALFFDPRAADYMAIAGGSLEKPTGLALAVHIWAQEAGDYYRISDGLPQRPDSSHGLTFPDLSD